MKPLSLMLLCLICIFFTFNSFSQKVKIEQTKIQIIDNKLVVEYDFVKSKKNQTFNVWLEINTSKSRKINASSLSGDIGDNVSGGQNKRIIWDYNKDGIVMGADEEIFVEVVASINKTGTSVGNSVLLSALVPGLGLSRIDRGKPYWLMGVATYGAVGASILFNKQASNDYSSYLKEEDLKTSKDLFNNSESKRDLSKTLGYAAAGIWTINMVWAILKAKKTGISTSSLISKKKILFYTGVDPRTKITRLSLKYRF